FVWGPCGVGLGEEDNMCLTPCSMGVYQNGGYGTHVLVPPPRHLIDLGSIDPAVAATYACSGITVYSAIKKVMPLPADEPLVVVGAGGLGLNAIAILKALGHRNIVAADVSAEKRTAALAAGATKLVESSNEGGTQRTHKACGAPRPPRYPPI